MIIIGYQGIGKSTLSKDNLEYIDLESSNFYVDGKRDENWYKPYCQIAEHLSRQGYYVFVSSHKEVRDFLNANCKEEVVAVCPSITLKNEWIAKLKNRYNESQLKKDRRALLNALSHYEENIKDISDDIVNTIFIRSINYNLNSVVKNYKLAKFVKNNNCDYI